MLCEVEEDVEQVEADEVDETDEDDLDLFCLLECQCRSCYSSLDLHYRTPSFERVKVLEKTVRLRFRKLHLG